jgi:hypothetical protein
VSDGWLVAAVLLLPQMDALSVDIEQLTVENAALSEVRWVHIFIQVLILLCGMMPCCSMFKQVHYLQPATSPTHAHLP